MLAVSGEILKDNWDFLTIQVSPDPGGYQFLQPHCRDGVCRFRRIPMQPVKLYIDLPFLQLEFSPLIESPNDADNRFDPKAGHIGDLLPGKIDACPAVAEGRKISGMAAEQGADQMGRLACANIFRKSRLKAQPAGQMTGEREMCIGIVP